MRAYKLCLERKEKKKIPSPFLFLCFPPTDYFTREGPASPHTSMSTLPPNPTDMYRAPNGHGAHDQERVSRAPLAGEKECATVTNSKQT